jgi:hypothetical protein
MLVGGKAFKLTFGTLPVRYIDKIFVGTSTYRYKYQYRKYGTSTFWQWPNQIYRKNLVRGNQERIVFFT